MIEIVQAGKIEIGAIVFSGGEAHVTIKEGSFDDTVTVVAQITSADEVMKLAMVAELLEHHGVRRRELVMHYLPYARQDRRCAPGDAFSLKVFAGIINSMDWDDVEILDPHSYVGPALINNVSIIEMKDIVKRGGELRRLAFNTTAVAPDLGASKKVYEVAQIGERTEELVQATKIRNPLTGNIMSTQVVYPEGHTPLGTKYTIWDDICDGGRTFIEIAKVLKQDEPKCEINLFVTHGIFSKGFIPLFEGGIDRIFTTNSLPQPSEEEFVLTYGQPWADRFTVVDV